MLHPWRESEMSLFSPPSIPSSLTVFMLNRCQRWVKSSPEGLPAAYWFIINEIRARCLPRRLRSQCRIDCCLPGRQTTGEIEEDRQRQTDVAGSSSIHCKAMVVHWTHSGSSSSLSVFNNNILDVIFFIYWERDLKTYLQKTVGVWKQYESARSGGDRA